MSSLDGATTQFWRESDHVMLETLMGRTQGEEAHKPYKEEDGRQFGLANWLLILVYLDYWAFFSCWVEYAMLFRTMHSCLGIPYPSLRGLLEEHFSSFFHIQAWGQASSFN